MLFPLRRGGWPALFLTAGISLAVSAPVSDAFAAETARSRVEARLEHDGFELVGESRRKGDVLIVTATRESISWLLVVDRRSGEIVGQRPLVILPANAD